MCGSIMPLESKLYYNEKLDNQQKDRKELIVIDLSNMFFNNHG